jgi:membrane-bound lytic murein transglycosylase D
MRLKTFLLFLSVKLFFFCAVARDITFCGERIPVNNDFVAQKLMDVIRKQVTQVNLPRLRREAATYFPMIQYYLKACGMPDDLKYIPIIESGFRNATSSAKAQGFWQLMEPTAKQWGLIVNGPIDERNNIYKSTIAALRELASLFKNIKKQHDIASWVLTAAAYNWGIGNLFSKMEKGYNNYWNMNLNPETAVYVYKIVAIKELFEYPEIYIKNFKYNVFNSSSTPNTTSATTNEKGFSKLELTVKKDAVESPDDAKIEGIKKPTDADLNTKDNVAFKKDAKLVLAQVSGKYPDFKDGDTVTIKLEDDLQTLKGFQRKGTIISGKGWVIEGRIFIDLGFNTKNVILYDSNSEQGIALSALKNKEGVILRVQN